jgi:hypothetical protein
MSFWCRSISQNRLLIGSVALGRRKAALPSTAESTFDTLFSALPIAKRVLKNVLVSCCPWLLSLAKPHVGERNLPLTLAKHLRNMVASGYEK